MLSNNRLLTLVTALMTVSVLTSSSTHGQIIYGRPASGGIQLFYSHWSLDDSLGTTEIDQFTVPVTGFLPIRDNFEAHVYLASSSNTLTQMESEYSLSGLGDVRLQVNRSFNDDRLLVSVGANLPTGKKKLSRDEELPVLQLLSQNILSFPLRRFGEGFGFNVLLGGAQMIGGMRCGAGVMYQFNGKYEPYQGSGNYDPGDFISVNAGADWQQDNTTIAGDAIFTTYFKDKVNGVEVFKQSTQLDLQLSAGYDTETYGVHGRIGYLLRGRNTLPEADMKIFGNEFSGIFDLTRHFGQGWSIAPVAEVKLVGASDPYGQEFGSSNIFGLGTHLGRKLGEQAALNVGGRYYFGSADDGNIDLSGFQLMASLTARL
ncbi:MAG: hypothetical protein ACE5K8_04600 [Candidatus Zixiibacteriota bacterium]